MDIPILVICYNNYKYVDNTLKQIKRINQDYYNNIIIINNCSTCVDTIKYLETVDCKVYNNESNSTPRVSQYWNVHIYNMLPDKYIVTDPDLQFHPDLPSNFIDILSDLSDTYNCVKIGFALDISDGDKMYQSIYWQDPEGIQYKIYEFEARYYSQSIHNENYKLHKADIDTTFSLFNKKYAYTDTQIRVAGNFTARHLPWYINNEIYTVYENYVLNMNTTEVSTIRKLVISYIENNYIKVHKNSELFLINNEDKNIEFWRDIYPSWKSEIFDVYDKYLSKDNTFVDIGAHIGAMSIYASRKCKHVYAIKCDDIDYLLNNLKVNSLNNYTISSDYNDIIDDNTCLINVNLEGKEESILDDLYNIHTRYNVPLCIHFAYDKWVDKNLDRFTYLSDENKQCLYNDSHSIMFIL